MRVPLIDHPVYVAVWRVKVGPIPLYLLDTDIESNDPESRITFMENYSEQLAQYMVHASPPAEWSRNMLKNFMPER